QVVDVEVAHAGVADLLRFEENVEPRQRFLKRYVAAPVEEVKVDLIDSEPAQAAIARRCDPLAGRVLRIELGHDEDLVAAISDRLAHDSLRAAPRIHLGGVDKAHAELDAGTQCRDLALLLALVLAHAPGALAKDGDGLTSGDLRGTDARHRARVEQDLCL